MKKRMIKLIFLRESFLAWGMLSLFFFIYTLIFSYSEGAGLSHLSKKVLMLGFDGMDPVLLKEYMAEGIMPNFKLLKEKGDFKALVTSMPPQSPVAWSNLITGMNPGGHGIFDFIARDPENYLPFLSTSKIIESKKNMQIGDWLIPFSKAETLLMRKGEAFWQILEAKGIPATVIKIPANFPPVKSSARTLSGMGTPDMLGTYGTFTFYTTRAVEDKEKITSGEIRNIEILNNAVKTQLMGPLNPFKAKKTRLSVKLSIKIDPENPVALIQIGDHEILLKEGEWSQWIKIDFKPVQFQTVSAICRFFLMKIRPDFELYVTPVNLDPYNPALPISTPENFSADLASQIGYFYTQGMPEDTKALNQNFLSNKDFLELSKFIKEERVRMLDLELKRFKNGLLFVYFSTADPVQHMFWRNIDKVHPAYDAEEAKQYSGAIKKTYRDMDVILGRAMKHIDASTTLIVLSDHGFGAFRRYFHLNTWLKENGYLNFYDENLKSSGEFFENVDFRKTKAYALGFNSLYINLAGREGMGIVQEGKEKLIEELVNKLENVEDPENGNRVIHKVYRKEDIYSGKYVKDAPDLLIGYNIGYRASWETALGKVPEGIMGNNMKKWSGTHLWDYKLVPGIILSNKKIKKDKPQLYDITPTILKEFGIDKESNMVGEAIF